MSSPTEHALEVARRIIGPCRKLSAIIDSECVSSLRAAPDGAIVSVCAPCQATIHLAQIIDRERAAARREAIEECEKIASMYPAFGAPGQYMGQAIPTAIAGAIRFLLAPETNNSGGSQ